MALDRLVADRQAVTVLDVAREAGVSVSTVSRIINGTVKVSEDKRLAVEDAIRRLEFKPNLFARSLKKGTTMTIGVLIQDVESPFFTRVMCGLEEGVLDTGYALIIVSGHWDAAEEAERIKLLMARRVDGLVILTGHLSDAQIAEFAQMQPIVVTGRKIDAENVRSVFFSNEEGGYLATRHLVSLGHRRIAFIAGPPTHSDAISRFEGYQQALAEAGIVLDPALIVQGDFKENGGVFAMNRLLDSGAPFTAVFAANDQTALGARMVLSRRGIRVPDDVSLVGFDDLPTSAYLTPPLTTIRQPLFEVGQHCASLLLGMLGQQGKAIALPPLELVVRETTRRV
ncbi:LacI family DNA-binding transcriptional regulator [Uliginosibacterium gangwonense]|uniref:LacI family DNA-binding transcriptional regulator n=1 Tax=Uliginosibacterium gangwonense TaxID=392736 RepID=UPI0003672684|nr:substrate-binding domain-containing protein [Uliginosibacterium gangwonense]